MNQVSIEQSLAGADDSGFIAANALWVRFDIIAGSLRLDGDSPTYSSTQSPLILYPLTEDARYPRIDWETIGGTASVKIYVAR